MENFIGEIRMFAGTFAPQGWLFCAGQSLDIGSNNALYSLIGTTYGGNGVSTFNLPDLRGRIPVGQGSGPGLTQRQIGQSGGEETHTLNSAEIPLHGHGVVVSGGPSSVITPGPTVLYGAVTPNGSIQGLYTAPPPPVVTPVQMSTSAVSSAGNSQPHGNDMATLTINFIIALTGIYPTQQ